MAIKKAKAAPVKKAKENMRYLSSIDLENDLSYAKLYKPSSYNNMYPKGDYDDVNYYEAIIKFRMDQLPYCCGVLEIGQLSINRDRRSSVTPLMIDNMLSRFLKDCIAKADGLAVVINTNGRDSSLWLEPILAKSRLFKLVKTFINPNSTRTIKMWISTK